MDLRPIPAALGGMDETVVTKNGVASRISNLVHDPEGYWRETPGTIQVSADGAGSGAIMSAVWFNPVAGQRWLVYEQASTTVRSSIRYLDFTTSLPVQIATRRRLASADRGTTFLENGRWLYMFSPVDAPLRWNGRWTNPVGFTGPAPQPLVAGYDQGFDAIDRAGGNEVTNIRKYATRQRGVGTYPDSATTYWRYGYALTMVNELGQESPPSAVLFASGQNDSAAATGFRLVRLKIPRMPDHVMGVRLYRTRNLIGVSDPGTQAQLYQLDEFPTGAGFDYIDSASDSELGLPFDPDSVGPVPLGPAAAAFWAGSLWLGGTPDNPTRAFYSSPLFPEQFPGNNYREVGSVRTGGIVAYRVVQRGLLVFKEHGVYMIRGSHAAGFSVETLSESVGCAAPRAIEDVPGLGTAFLAKSAPHVVIGTLNDEQVTKVVPMPGMRRTWRRYAGNLAQAVSVYNPEFNELWFQIPKGGDVRPTLGLVYHVDLGQWSLRGDWSVSCFTRHLERIWVGSWDDTSYPGMHLLTYGSDTRIGEASQSGYQTYFTFDDPVKVAKVEVWALATGGSSPIALSTVSDRQTTAAQTTVGKSQLANRRDLEVWGTAFWGTGEWADYAPARLVISTRMITAREIGVLLSTTRIRMFGLQLDTVDTIEPNPERL